MAEARPGDFGLTESAIEEIRARDRRQAELFVRLLAGGCGLVWLVLTALIYARSARTEPLLGLLVAPLLGLLGAVIAGLPVAVTSAIVSWLAIRPHPQARALERYEAATAGIRPCEVCRLARGDHTPKEGVAYCSKCGAWICRDCRRRYDLRAIAALKRQGKARGGGSEG
jgi:acyl CoA:acetate/3-ketoacid CoA transferase alpha subunit